MVTVSSVFRFSVFPSTYIVGKKWMQDKNKEKNRFQPLQFAKTFVCFLFTKFPFCGMVFFKIFVEKWRISIWISLIISLKATCRIYILYGIGEKYRCGKKRIRCKQLLTPESKEVIANREKHFLQKVTPMIAADLIVLSTQYETVICEGDIDYAAIIPIAEHFIYLHNCGILWIKKFCV